MVFKTIGETAAILQPIMFTCGRKVGNRDLCVKLLESKGKSMPLTVGASVPRGSRGCGVGIAIGPFLAVLFITATLRSP